MKATEKGVNKASDSKPAPVPKDAPAFFTKAMGKAKKGGRPVIIDFWAEWCVPCKRLKNETMADPEVAKALEGVEVIFVDLDKHPELAKAYAVKSIPDVFFVNPEGLIIDRVKKFEQAGPFLERVNRLHGADTTPTPTEVGPRAGNTEVRRARLGLSTSVPSNELAELLELENRVRVRGRVIDRAEGPALEAGLRKGDVLLKLGDVDLYSADDISDFLRVSSPGARVPIAFKREGNTDVLEVVVSLGKDRIEATSGPEIRWQFASLGQLPRALEVARAQKKKVMVGLSGAET